MPFDLPQLCGVAAGALVETSTFLRIYVACFAARDAKGRPHRTISRPLMGPPLKPVTVDKSGLKNAEI
jgi:hypothetical protein